MTNETQPFDQETWSHLKAVVEGLGLGHHCYQAAMTVADEAARLAARQPAPVVGEEELLELFRREGQCWVEGKNGYMVPDDFDPILGIRAVRDAILAAQAVQVPENIRDTLASYIAAEYYLDHEPHKDDERHQIWGEVDNILAIVSGEKTP